MRKHLLLFASAVVMMYAFSFFVGTKNAHVREEQDSPGRMEEEDGGKGPELERWYFEKWHQPHGAVLQPDMMQRIWADVQRVPSENDFARPPVTTWLNVGPVGQNVVYGGVSQNAKYSGRILDIEVDNGASTRMAAASGGLWGGAILFWVPMADQLTSQAIGSFATKPGDPNTIFVGTGEPQQRGGTGLWKTTNAGTTWTRVTLSPEPAAFYRVRFTPDNANKVHLATTSGYYRSTDAGTTWTRILTGDCTDLAISRDVSNIVYTARWGDGVYYSNTGGASFTKITTGGLPTTNVGRTAISIPNDPNYVWISIAKNDDSGMLGVYKTTNAGTSWVAANPPENFLGAQGWYDNVIACSPVAPATCLVGGVTLFKTTNAGTTWTRVDDVNVHVDHHAIRWNSTGTAVWNGNDGGLSFSNDGSATWSTAANNLSITQYVNFGVGTDNSGVIFGGSQDNGYSGTTNGGSTWNHTLGGDGGGIAVDPANNAARVFGTLGVYGGSWAFQRHRSTDFGQNWTGINTGIDASAQWYHKIRSDMSPPIYLFNNSGPYVYRSLDAGASWTKVNTTAFPAEIYNMTVSRYVTGGSVIYACLSASSPAGQQLRVFDNGTWYERSTGFPTSVWVRGVTPDPNNANNAFALMNGLTAGQKVYKTTNRGVTWTNISGNLPNVPLGDLVVYPANNNLLFLGTEMGCYRTTNGGTSWYRWNNGMPEATIVTEMSYIDSVANGRFYILAATYGRSVWKREISGDDPTAVTEKGTVPNKFDLSQNYPNPFNPSTTIRFSLPRNESVDLRVYDVSGREVATLVSGETTTAGDHSINFNASKLASGVYFYRLKAGSFVETRKMTLLK